MSEPKFTPGPWRVCNQALIFSGENIIAETYGYDDHVFSNAHLIAAAPDLYTELETVCDELEHRIKAEYSDMTNYPSALRDMELELTLVKAARAALAKARGEGNE